MIPPESNSEFVAHMEQVLDLYKRPYDPRLPVVCMDESPKQLIGSVRQEQPMGTGRLRRPDYEYVRCGVCNIFMANEPLRGKRYVSVTERKTNRCTFRWYICYRTAGQWSSSSNVEHQPITYLKSNPRYTSQHRRKSTWYGGQNRTDKYGHGRLNAYEVVKHALPNQFNSPFFAVWPSQDIGGSHIFGDSYLEFGTLIIPEGKAAVFSGTLTGFGGDYAKIRVQGNMVVESGTQLTDLSIEVAPTGRLIVRDGATIRPGSLGELLVEVYARLGSDVVVRRGDIEVGTGGSFWLAPDRNCTSIPARA